MTRRSCLILFLLLFHLSSNVNAEVRKFANLSRDTLLLPHLWATDVNDQELFVQIIDGKVQHPLTIGRTAFTYLFVGQSTKNAQMKDKGKQILDVLDQYPLTNTADGSTIYFYPADFRDLKGGEWWSGMANSSIAMAYLIGFEIFEDEEYKQKAIRAINGVINPIDKNGSAITLSDSSRWYLEYVDGKRTQGNAYFVHNGFLFSLVAMKCFELILEDNKRYKRAYHEGMNALKEKEKDYYYYDNDWTYYMLNPLTIESIHYAVYELILLESIYLCDKSEFLEKTIRKRRSILKREYPVILTAKEDLFFNTLGAPHPYWPDIYPTTILVHYKDGSNESHLIHPKDSSHKEIHRFFIKKNVSIEIDSVEVFQEYNGWRFRLYAINPVKIDYNHAELIKSENKGAYQGKSVGHNEITISSGNDQNRAMVRYIFSDPKDLYKCNYFGWVFNSEIEITNMRITMINKNDKNAGRYYIPQPAQKNNLILMKGISFEFYEQLKDKEIKEIQVSYYYPEFIDNTKSIRFSNIFKFDDPEIIYRIIQGEFGTFNFETKTTPGNIY